MCLDWEAGLDGQPLTSADLRQHLLDRGLREVEVVPAGDGIGLEVRLTASAERPVAVAALYQLPQVRRVDISDAHSSVLRVL